MVQQNQTTQTIQNLEEFIEKILEDAQYDDEAREALNTILRRYGYEVKPPKMYEAIEKKIKPIMEENEKLKKELENRKRKELEQRYIDVLQKYGLSPNDMQSVVEFAKKNGILDFETACRYYVIENRSAKPQYPYGIIEKEKSLIEKYKGRTGKNEFIKDALDLLERI